jgi:hypothetical protein
MRVWIFVVLMLPMFSAKAATYCASTGNELNVALNDAGHNGQHDDIRVTVGTHITDYHFPTGYQWIIRTTSEEDLDKSVTVSGGWSTGDNCATQVSANPSDTILDARYWGPVFLFLPTNSVPGWVYTGTFALRNMTLNRGKSNFNNQTTGLLILDTLGSPGSLVVDNVHALNGQSAFEFAAAINMNVGGSGSMRLRNSIVSLNTFTGANSRPVFIGPYGSVVAYVSNNSIFDNSVTSHVAGLHVWNIATVSNNAIADNVSSTNPSYQFYSDIPTSLTLQKNHFGSKQFDNGAPFSEVDTTTGNAFWAPLGVERIPLDSSPLRDSGDNTPTGGALAIDFRGNPRIVNTTIDRGASEAPAPSNPAEGPLVTDDTPVKGSTTYLTAEPGQTAFGEIHFSVSAGQAGGLTLIECQVTSGTVLIGAYSSQWVATGGSAEPVLLGFDNVTETEQTGVVFCSFTRTGIAGFTWAAWTFKSRLETLFEDGFE